MQHKTAATPALHKTSTDVDNITHSLSFGMKELFPGPSNISPAKKRGRFDYKTPFSTVVLSSVTARMVKVQENRQKYPPKQHWTDILKSELTIVNEEQALHSLLDKCNEITNRLQMVKGDPPEGNLCRKCHLQLGHTARNCAYGHCQSVFSCSEEKLHVGKLNVKELSNNIRRKEAK